jgi:hypothetical protein
MYMYHTYETLQSVSVFTRSHHVSCAAQESRVQLRREKEWQDDLIKKYYAEQRSSDAAAREALKAPVKRREREAKERQAEIDMLETMYRVSSVEHGTDDTPKRHPYHY